MKPLLISLLLLITYSCTFDYDIGDDLPPFKSQVVLNSSIAPHKPIEIEMLWSIPTPNSDSVKVDSFRIKIYEGGKLILDSIGKDGLLKTNKYPKAGFTYSLEVNVDDYGSLTAETYIPSIPYKVRVDSIKRVKTYFFHFEINKVDISEKARALWLNNIFLIGINELYNSRLSPIYATNPYIDQINARYLSQSNYGTNNINSVTGSVIEHDPGFLRVPFKNLTKVFPIKLSLRCSPKVQSIEFIIITPSDDYDRYYRDYYRDTPSGSISIGSKNVYSNIKGGLGIFAGYIEEVETVIYSKQIQK